MRSGSLLWQTTASVGRGSAELQSSYTRTQTRIECSLSCCREPTSLACPGPRCWGAFLPMCSVCRLHPTFLCSVLLQHRDALCSSLTGANLISFSASPLPRGRSGGMIVDPLRSGRPQPGIDPSSGIPGRLPPGAVPPGARFDPFGPLGAGRSGWVFSCASYPQPALRAAPGSPGSFLLLRDGALAPGLTLL